MEGEVEKERTKKKAYIKMSLRGWKCRHLSCFLYKYLNFPIFFSNHAFFYNIKVILIFNCTLPLAENTPTHLLHSLKTRWQLGVLPGSSSGIGP